MKKIIITGGLGYIGTELCKIYSGVSWHHNILVIDSCNSKIDLGKLYETRILIRDSICKKFKFQIWTKQKIFNLFDGSLL